MSRKMAPPASRTNLSRRPSTNTISSSSRDMPPPRVPSSRPASALSVSSNSAKHGPANGGDHEDKTSRPKNGGNKQHGQDVDENGEINIQVVVRCRGRSPLEIQQRTPIITTTTGAVSSNITIETSSLTASSMSMSSAALGLPMSSLGGREGQVSKTYAFDKVFGPEADQTCVYREVGESMLDEVLRGYNCTIFAYGQTGTGKTYTMQGDLNLTPLQTPSSDAGIIPRVLHRLFQLLDSTANAEWSVKCSYVELYNEELRDLLSADYREPGGNGGIQPMGLGAGAPGASRQEGLKIYEDQNKRGGVMIQGLEEASVRSLGEALALLIKGTQRRQVAETKMNSESSRSHSIFSLTVHLKETGAGHAGEDLLKVGKLNLVDLAGSEAIGRSGAVDKRAREAGMINQSLLTLGRVISALVEKGSHIPYRESKLTRLLQDSLGGRTKTCIVAAVSPTKSNMEETLSTLDYAIRAKTIRNKPEVNQRMTKGALIKEYVVELERLKADLMAAREKNGVYFSAESWKDMTEEQEERRSQLEEALQRASTIENKHATLSAEFETNMSMLVVRDEELKVARKEAIDLGVALQQVKEDLQLAKDELEEERLVSEAYRRGEAKLDRVAKGLKGTVEESVKDVGSLFAKIARKAEVMTVNTDAANAYGSELGHMADQLRHDVSILKRVQSDFGKTLQTELEAFAKRGAKTLEQDKLFLNEQLAVFAQSITSLQSEIDSSCRRSVESNQATLSAQSDLETSLGDWIAAMRVEAQEMATDLVTRHKSQMSMVEAASGDITQMLEAVIAGALEHSDAEMKDAKDMAAVHQQTAAIEMARLRSQNQKLAQLLATERETSARLRENMVAQIASLLSGFTQAQDERLQAAVAEVQQDNENGMSQLIKQEEFYDGKLDDMSKRAEQYVEDMDTVKAAGVEHARHAEQAIADATSSVSGLVSEQQARAMQSAASQSAVISTHSTTLKTSLDTERRAVEAWSRDHAKAVGQLNTRVADTYAAAKDRLIVAKEDIKVVSAAVLDAHTAAEPVFGKHCSAALAHIADLQQSNSAFIASIKQDMATGSTPRKKVWNVPSAWQLTGSRDSVLEKHRRKLASGLAESHAGDVSEVAMMPLEDGVAGDEQAELEALTEPVASIPNTLTDEVSPPMSTISSAMVSPEMTEQENLPPASEVLSQSSREPSPNDIIKQTISMSRTVQQPKSRPVATNIGRLNSSQLGRSKTASTSEDKDVAALGDAGTNANTGIPMRRPKRMA